MIIRIFLLSFLMCFNSPIAFAQDEDLDLSTQESKDFNDLESELDNAVSSEAPATPEEVAPTEVAKPTEPAAPTEEPLDIVEEKKAEEPPPPTIEEEKKEEVAEPTQPVVPEPQVEPPPPEVKEAEMPPPSISEPVAESENDSPDEEFEARLARIYKQFYTERTSDPEWEQIAGPKSTERYSVQTGDTMWGISQTFFGNGFFWPKLWQLNSEYTNPHILEISDSIQFSPGSLAVEPTINLAQGSSKYNEPDPPPASVTQEQAKAYMANVKMPDAPPRRPVMNKLPKSLPTYSASNKGYDQSGFSVKSVKRFTIEDIMLLPTSISETTPAHDGEVVESETGLSLINLYQEGVAELENAKENDTFFSFRVLDKISNEYGQGFPIEYQGEFQVIEDLGGGKFRVLCTEATAPTNVGSLLRKGVLPKVDVSKTGEPSLGKFAVLGGQYDSERQQLGAGNLIFISGGKSQGLESGQLLTVLKNNRLRNSSTVIKTPQRPIGLVKIVDVGSNLATGYILESKEDLRPGDVTGPGNF